MIDSSGLGEKTGHGRTWQGVSRLLSGGNETQGGRDGMSIDGTRISDGRSVRSIMR